MSRTSLAAVLTTLVLIVPVASGDAVAQSGERSARDRTSRIRRTTPTRSGSTSRLPRTSRPSSRGPGAAGAPSGLSRARGSSPASPGRTGSEDGEAAPSTNKTDETEASASGGSLVQRLRRWVSANRVLVFGVLGALCVGGFVWLAIAGRRRGKGGETFLEALDDELSEGSATATTPSAYSSTRIRAQDVNARLGGGTVEGERIETGREYALVVDEEAIRRPPPGEVDAHTGKEYAEDSAIRELLDRKQFEDAWDEYRSRVDLDGSVEFHSDLERALSEHFLQQRDLGKAAAVLEHHVATHASATVEPEVYFNLGYIHFLTKTFNKSRRFLRLYVKSDVEAEYKDRARAILQRLERPRDRLN